MAKQVVSQVLEYGEVRRGRLGISIQSLTPDLSEALELGVNEGAVVMQVEPGSAAEKAGIEAGDVIVSFNNEPVTGSGDLRNKVGLAPVGTTVTLGVVADGERRRIEVPILESSATATASSGAGTAEQLPGVTFRNLDPSHPLAGRVRGVVVARIEPGSDAQRSQLAEGDVVVAVNRTPVTSVAELRQALATARRPIALNVMRGEAQIFVVIR
jgi:S1-C subfamily serine protease